MYRIYDMVIPERVYERLMRSADRNPETGCLVSRYSAGSHGYAQIGWSEDGQQHMALAHRAVWIHERGPLTDGMTVDHRQGACDKKCIEILHLRELTNRENARRNQGFDWPLGAICWRGHGEDQLRSRVVTRRGRTYTASYCYGCERLSKNASQRRIRAERKF